MANLNNHDDSAGSCDCCRNELNLDKLCVKKFKTKHLCTCKIDAKDACIEERLDAKDAYFKDADSDKICANEITAKDVSAGHICVDNLDVSSSLCVRELSTPMVCAQDISSSTLSSQSLCAEHVNAMHGSFQNLTANNVCLPGQTKAADLLACGKYRATASYSADTVYTLGDYLHFDVINDDPNGNIVQIPHTKYVAPLSGYYMLSFRVVQNNLLAAVPILGNPVANLEVWINGVHVGEQFSAYIPFFNEQKNILSTLFSMNAGDEMAFKYKVLAVDNIVGQYEVIGTVDLEGNGSESVSTAIKVHLLSVNCVDLPCAPSVACERRQCTPCIPQSLPCRSCEPEPNMDCMNCWPKAQQANAMDGDCDSCQ